MKTAAAVINARGNHSAMVPSANIPPPADERSQLCLARPGYITAADPPQRTNRHARRAVKPHPCAAINRENGVSRRSGLRGLGIGALAGDIRRLEQDGGVFGAEYFRGETYRRIGLSLTERAFARARLAQPVEQRRHAGVEIMLKLRMHSQRRL